MPTEIDWIKRALAADRSKTQTGIAAAIGVDKSAVSRLLKGERRLAFAEAVKISEYLGAPLPSSFGVPGLAESAGAEETAPVYPVTRDAVHGLVLNRAGAPIDRKPKAPNFRFSRDVFGLFAPDASHAPRFKTGEIAWADPARPIQAGDDALFLRALPSGGEEMLIGELVQASASSIDYFQHTDGV